jgi:60 kDa SS-A/Ro ribonucleoprotein
MTQTYRQIGTRSTPQTEKIFGSDQVKNEAGGFSFKVDDWTRLNRWLILGSEKGTYYVAEKEFTLQNAEGVLRCIKSDGKRTVDTIVEISESGRAAKNEPALFALAMAASLGSDETRAYALSQLQRVARTGTHLLHFVAYCSGK